MAPNIPNQHEIIRLYNLKNDYAMAKAIQDALRKADETDAMIEVAEARKEWPKTLKFFHGTSWENAEIIRVDGFKPSDTGCLGRGVYVGRADKALRFAQDGERHGGSAGALLEVLVTISNPKFVAGNDDRWQTEGYDACRTDYTTASQNMEWCIKDAANVRLLGDPIKFPVRPPPDAAPVGNAREQAIKAFQDTAIAFGQLLFADPALQAKCEDVLQFKAEFVEWKRREAAAGRVRRCAPAGCLMRLSRTKPAVCAALSCVRLNVVGSVVLFGAAAKGRRAAGVAAAAQRVHENRAYVEADKGGVVVLPAGRLFAEDIVVPLGEEVRREVEVINTTDAPITLKSTSLLNQRFCPSFSLPGTADGGATVLPAQRSVKITFACRPRQLGMSRDVLNLELEGPPGVLSSIGRYVEVRCGDLQLLSALAPTAPFKRKKRRAPPPPIDEVEVLPAPKLEGGGGDATAGGGSNIFSPPKLYQVEPGLRRSLDESDDVVAERLEDSAEKIGSLPAGDGEREAAATIKLYIKHFQTLLWVEEIQLVRDLHQFDLVDQDAIGLGQRGKRFSLHVKGLAEKRPSVLKGDVVRINFPGDRRRIFEGRAEAIEMEDVLLATDYRFNKLYTPGQPVEVSFTLSRMALRIFHQGLHALKDVPSAVARLFPSPRDLAAAKLHPPRTGDLSVPLTFYNRDLNVEQQGAVRQVVDGVARHVPYVIFGPPGTGKTTTVAEAIVQCAKGARKLLAKPLTVLACAPTNTAADVLAERLVRVLNSKMELLRLVARSRSHSDMPAALLPYSNWDADEESFAELPIDAIKAKQVVVATLCTAGKLINLNGMERGHFDLVVLDEAGQALEPEAIAPAAALLGEGGQLVVAGDPKQLGPVIHHRIAADHGLGCSLLERLMCRPVYQKQGGQYDARVLTKLVQNFRAHADLLELPNRLFYEGDLRCCADPMLINCCLQWEGLPTPGVPLFFHGLVGKDTREKTSPSWFNPDEVAAVIQHVKDLCRPHSMGRGGMKITPAMIGVIAPYNMQVQRIRFALKGFDLGDVKVGSTEMFQGQERRIILISTVRSSEDYVGSDVRHNLGFLDNPKRFNVAITRACALLIVVGNPAVLMLDKHWRALLELCVRKGAYRGVPVVFPDQAPADSLADDIARLHLHADDPDDAEQQDPTHRMQQEHAQMPEFE